MLSSPIRAAGLRLMLGLVLLLILVCGLSRPGAAQPAAAGALPPLQQAILRADEIAASTPLPVTLKQGADATQELAGSCGLDCAKWYWGGTNSLSITLSRAGSEPAAQQAVQNLRQQYQGYRAALKDLDLWDCPECSAPVMGWQIQHGKGSDDIILASTHGAVWILMRLHVEGNPDTLFRDYCQGEDCWQDDVQEYGFNLFALMRLQHRKLALNGYPPLGTDPQPIPRTTPTPTAVTPPADALHRLDFLSAAPVCALPCLNHLEPGKSTTQDIPVFFNRLGLSLKGPLPADGTSCMDLSGIPGGISYPYPPELCVTWKEERVQYITLDLWNHPELFQMGRVARVLGPPEKILAFYGMGLGAAGSPNYSIALHYPQKGLMLEIQGFQQNQPPWSVCLADRRKQTTRIVLYAPDSAAEALNRFFGPDSAWYPWHEELGLSLPDLFTRMQDSARCIPYNQ